jgi:type III pantothenate kinase
MPSSPSSDPRSGDPRSGDAILVADVGNTRIKLAAVVAGDRAGRAGPPALTRRQDLDSRDFRPANLGRWLEQAAPGPAVLFVASVHDAAAARLEAAIAELSATRHAPLRHRRVGHEHLPLEVAVAEPHRVGIDRLAAAAAAGLLKRPARPAIVVDCGTAATVNLVSAAGGFLGGAILPGPSLMAAALAEGTSRLPRLEIADRSSPPALPGRSTQEAIAAGIGWGLRGAILRLVAEARTAVGGDADVIVTGGWRAAVLGELPGAIEVEDLVLAGVALAAERAARG